MSPPAPCLNFPSYNYWSSNIQPFSNSIKKHTELSREEKCHHFELPCRRTRNSFSPGALSQHPPSLQGGLCPTGPCPNRLYRDTLWTEGIRCAGTEQLAFFKARKQLKGLMGTTEHLKRVRTSMSSWIPATH